MENTFHIVYPGLILDHSAPISMCRICFFNTSWPRPMKILEKKTVPKTRPSSWLGVSLQNCVWSPDSLTTFVISECHFANLAGPCSSTEMRPHDPKSMCVPALQFWKHSILKYWKLLRSTSKMTLWQPGVSGLTCINFWGTSCANLRQFFPVLTQVKPNVAQVALRNTWSNCKVASSKESLVRAYLHRQFVFLWTLGEVGN